MIEIKNQPRATGKTTTLKLKVFETILKENNIGCRANIVILSAHVMQCTEFLRYYEQLEYNDVHVYTNIVSNQSLDKFFRFCELNSISHIFIDECFELDGNVQADIIEFCSEHKINIFGIGTLRRKTFSDFI